MLRGEKEEDNKNIYIHIILDGFMARRVSFVARKPGAKRGTRVTFYSTRKKKR